MGNCIGQNTYNLPANERAKRKSEDFRIELDMCDKKYASEMNRLMLLDFELGSIKAENEKLRREMHRLVAEQGRVTRTIKTQELKSQVRLANLHEQHQASVAARRQSELDFESIESKLKLITKLCSKKKTLKRHDESIIYMVPSRPKSVQLDEKEPNAAALKKIKSLPHNAVFHPDMSTCASRQNNPN